MDAIPVSQIEKWFRMNQRPDWDILQQKNALFGYDDNDNIEESLTRLKEALDELPAGTYIIRAKKFKAPNSAYKQVNFVVPIDTFNSTSKMPKNEEIEKEIYQRVKMELMVEQLVKDNEQLSKRLDKLEDKFNELLNIVDDLFDDDTANDGKAKNDLMSLVKNGSQFVESVQPLAKSFLKK